jgi:hypothetical protein
VLSCNGWNRFFALLNEKKYSGLDLLYGRSYELVRGRNPDNDPSDHAVLLAGASGYVEIQLISISFCRVWHGGLISSGASCLTV